MTYKKVEVTISEELPVFAGGCGDTNPSACGASVHRQRRGACGDYNPSACASSVHRSSGNDACGDFNPSACSAKVHRK